MLEYIHIVSLVFLSLGTYFDCFRNRKINDTLFVFWVLGIMAAVSLGMDLIAVRFAVAIVMFVLLYTYSKKKGFGMADVFAITIISFSLVPTKFVLWFTLAYILMGIFSVVNAMHDSAGKKLNRKNLTRLISRPYPFFPFMLGAYIVMLLLGL